jgi:hypothetical protein
VTQLEEELGQAIFLRSTPLQLTPFGAYLAPILEEALRGIDDVSQAAARFRGNAETVIRLGLLPLVDARLLTRVLEPFARKTEVHYQFRWHGRRELPPHVQAFVEHCRAIVPTIVRGAAREEDRSIRAIGAIRTSAAARAACGADRACC